MCVYMFHSFTYVFQIPWNIYLSSRNYSLSKPLSRPVVLTLSMAEYTASLEGTISWSLICDYDNTGNNGTIRDKLSLMTSESIQYEVFKTSFNRTIRSDLRRRKTGGVGASYKALLAKVDYASADLSTEMIETIEATTTTTFKANLSKTRSYERNSECMYATTDIIN